MTICPCCGFRFEGNLSGGCEACGARSVGEALPRPERVLPSYARSLLLAVTGTLVVLVFLTQTIVALLQRPPISLSFWLWIGAAETAAWRLKWVAIPFTIIILWGSRKIYGSMLQSPARFCGLRYARGGLLASALIPVLIAVLIGVTIPERLLNRQFAIEAGFKAQGYTIDRALFEYRAQFGRLPDVLNDLRLVPDPSGSIAEALANLDPLTFPTAYKPSSADVAALPKQKPQALRSTIIRNVSLNTIDDTLGEGLSLPNTNYELRLPGEDKLMRTDDDWIVRDGVISKASDPARRPGHSAASSQTTRP